MKRKIFIVITLGLVLSFGITQQTPVVRAQRDTPACAPVPDGLIYWLRGENNANDVTGIHDGTLYGGTSFSSGMVGNAFSFDGGDDYVLIPPSEDIPHGSDARTVEMWIYSISDSWQHDARPAFHTGQGSPHAAFGIDFDYYPTIQFYTWTDDLYIYTGLPEIGWFHVAMTYDGNTLISAYINGALSDSKTLSAVLNTENLDSFIGAGIDQFSNPQFFAGRIDEVSMYNRDLSISEILSIYNAGSSGKCSLKPIADAGSDQTVHKETLVTLDGQLSYDPDNNLPLAYSWTQTSGEEVELNKSDISCPAFIAPSTSGILTFSLVVTDSLGLESDPDTVNIYVDYYQNFLPILLLY